MSGGVAEWAAEEAARIEGIQVVRNSPGFGVCCASHHHKPRFTIPHPAMLWCVVTCFGAQSRDDSYTLDAEGFVRVRDFRSLSPPLTLFQALAGYAPLKMLKLPLPVGGALSICGCDAAAER